jgi:hypothetical protein
MEESIAIVGFFSTVIIISIGVPLVRSYVRRREAQPLQTSSISDARLARMESALESVAIEIERISEGQRFVTKLLAERDTSVQSLPNSEPR